ncbi:MAG: TerB family tellurite resistance protein [Limisphaerales bacterium]
MLEDFVREQGVPPSVVVRALYSLDGGMGEAFVAATTDRLVVFSKKLSGPWRNFAFPFAEIESLALLADGSFCKMDIVSTRRRASLKFSGWDRPTLDRIATEWAVATGHSVRVGRDAEHAVPLTPLTLFCAALQAAMQLDGDRCAAEELFLSQAITDAQAVQEGLSYWEQNGTDETVAAVRERLNADQQWCVLANAVAMIMADGKLTSEEQEFTENLRAEWHIAQADYDQILQVLYCKNNLAVFMTADGQVATEALKGFYAGLLAMCQADGQPGETELAMIRSLAAGADPVEAAQRVLDADGVDGLLARLPELLTPEQCCCLYANLIVLAMSDGTLRSREQALLQRVRETLRIAEETADLLYTVLYRKHNVALLSAG